MKRVLAEQSGITLVETLVAAFILGLVVVSVTGILMASQASAKQVSAWQDETQQLRFAMRQMASDLSYSHWDDSTPASGTVQAWIYTPYTVPGTEEGDWPGNLDPSLEFTIKYTLGNGVLVREVTDFNFGQTYTRQVLATGLTADSVLTADSTTRLIRVTLRKQMPGVKRIAEVSSAFHIR